LVSLAYASLDKPGWRNGPPRLGKPKAKSRRVDAQVKVKMYYVYILVSEVQLKTYTGITDNPERRLDQHNNKNSFYTKSYVPWQLIYLEELPDRELARKREKYFKSAAGRRWMKKEFFSN